VGRLAVITVPSGVEVILKVPPISFALSRIPDNPTPGSCPLFLNYDRILGAIPGLVIVANNRSSFTPMTIRATSFPSAGEFASVRYRTALKLTELDSLLHGDGTPVRMDKQAPLHAMRETDPACQLFVNN